VDAGVDNATALAGLVDRREEVEIVNVLRRVVSG